MPIFRAKLINLSEDGKSSNWKKKNGETFNSDNVWTLFKDYSPWADHKGKPKIGGWYEIWSDTEDSYPLPLRINRITPCVCRECNEWTGTYEMLCVEHLYQCRTGCGKRVRSPHADCAERKCDSCNAMTCSLETHCFSHKKLCPISNCSQRISSNETYCICHRNRCQFEGCGKRIHQSNNYCDNHTFEKQVNIYKTRWENETNKANNLQLRLNTADTKIIRTQTNLGVNNLDNLATELRGEDGNIWTIGRWKEELKMEREHAENMDNFYRQQFLLNNNLEHVRNELSRQILEINQEKQQKEKENNNLKELVRNLEMLAIQTKDDILPEKIEGKQNQLEQLKNDLVNNLTGNWHEKLEDVLEAQATFIQSNNDLTLNQLRKFKQRLLNSGLINQDELDRICQVQAELSFLKLKQQQEQQFQTQIEI